MLYSVHPPPHTPSPSNSNLEHLEYGDGYLYLQKECSADPGWELLWLNTHMLTLKWLIQFAPLLLTSQHRSVDLFLLRRMASGAFKANAEQAGRQSISLANAPLSRRLL